MTPITEPKPNTGTNLVKPFHMDAPFGEEASTSMDYHIQQALEKRWNNAADLAIAQGLSMVKPK